VVIHPNLDIRHPVECLSQGIRLSLDIHLSPAAVELGSRARRATHLPLILQLLEELQDTLPLLAGRQDIRLPPAMELPLNQVMELPLSQVMEHPLNQVMEHPLNPDTGRRSLVTERLLSQGTGPHRNRVMELLRSRPMERPRNNLNTGLHRRRTVVVLIRSVKQVPRTLPAKLIQEPLWRWGRQ